MATRARELMESELLAQSDDICTHPEVGYKETRSLQRLAETLGKHNFSVEVGVGGFEPSARTQMHRKKAYQVPKIADPE